LLLYLFPALRKYAKYSKRKARFCFCFIHRELTKRKQIFIVNVVVVIFIFFFYVRQFQNPEWAFVINEYSSIQN